MKDFIINIFKGVFIGVANVIPGVSGGTIAVSVGVYEKIINAITNLKKEFKKSFFTLLPFLIGIALGIVGLSFVVTYLLEKHEAPTLWAFIGFILGSVPMLFNKVKNEKFKFSHCVALICTILAIVIPTILSSGATAIDNIELNFVNVILLAIFGLICAAAMVVPGISGSMILMMLGYYNSVMQLIKGTISSLVHFEFDGIVSNILLLIPFGIGALVGIVLISNIISVMLKKYPNLSMWIILGLIVASPFAIIGKATGNIFSFNIFSVIAFAVCFTGSYLLSKKS